MLLTSTQLKELLRRLSWTPVYEDEDLALCRVRVGYSDDKEIAKIQASLSIMIQAQAELERRQSRPGS